MFGLREKITRRDKRSPYRVEYTPLRHGERGGSTVSLPTAIGARSSSSLLQRPPTQQAHRSPLEYEASSARRIHAGRDKALPPLPPRPSTFHDLLGPLSDTAMGYGYFQDRRQNSRDGAISPVALPQKALALLGIDERSGFGSPASPIPMDREESLFSHGSDSDEDGGSTQRGSCRPRTRLAPPPPPPPPERLYFRPESLCSSFSTSSDRTETTAVTTMTPTSPSTGSMLELKAEQENGTWSTMHSDSTLRGGVSMLNLDDDSDVESDAGDDDPTLRTGELPPEIALQVCQYFATETHLDDTPSTSTFCPNCNIYTLWSLSLVSRAWSTAANKVLYDTIPLDFGWYTALSWDSNGQGIPPTYVPYTSCTTPTGEPLHTKTSVQTKLPLLYRTIWDSQGDIGERIRGIKAPRRLFNIAKYPLLAIVQKCPNLEFIDHAIASGSTDELVSLLSGLREMKRWSWKREQGIKNESAQASRPSNQATVPGPPLAIPQQVIPLWTKLLHLELDSLRSTDIPAKFDISTSLPSLRSMALRHVDVPDLFSRLPPLEVLEIENCSVDHLLSYIEHKGRTITSLTLTAVDIDVATLYAFLPHLPRLTTLRVTNTGHTASPLRIEEEVPPLEGLRRVHIEMKPLAESIGFLLAVVTGIEGVRWIKVGGRGDSKASEETRRGSLDEGDRLLVKLQMECMFNRIDLVVM